MRTIINCTNQANGTSHQFISSRNELLARMSNLFSKQWQQQQPQQPNKFIVFQWKPLFTCSNVWFGAPFVLVIVRGINVFSTELRYKHIGIRTERALIRTHSTSFVVFTWNFHAFSIFFFSRWHNFVLKNVTTPKNKTCVNMDGLLLCNLHLLNAISQEKTNEKQKKIRTSSTHPKFDRSIPPDKKWQVWSNFVRFLAL